MQLNEAIALRIKELCNKNNMTQYQLYLKSGVPQSTLSTILNCTFQSMKLRIIYNICPVRHMNFSRNYRWVNGHENQFTYSLRLVV